MRKGFIVAFASGAAALTISLGTTAAIAGTHTAAVTKWTITPGGAVTGSAGKTTLKDTKTGTVLTCKSSATAATLESGSGQKNPIGKITSVTFTSCSGPGGLTFTATTSASSSDPWDLSATSYNSTSEVAKGKITGVTASLSGSGCTATVAGTTATTAGEVTGTYSNKTHILEASGGDLHIWNVSAGCLGLINTGDPSSFVGKYTITPPQTITPTS